MNTRSIPFGRPDLNNQDRERVNEVLKGHILTHGPQGQEFENKFVDFVGGGHSVALSSCFAALHLGYRAVNIGPGDEVIVPSQTHVATVHALEMTGASPVFVDCELETGNLSPSSILQAITEKTKGICLVHFAGIPCDMAKIMPIADERGLFVIEDAATALGAKVDGVHVGLWGDAGCFSFYPVKHITTGEGGMLLTRHEGTADQVGKMRAFGIERTKRGYDVTSLGFNFRMSEFQATLGKGQLDRFTENLTGRAHNFDVLKRALLEVEGMKVLDVTREGLESSHYCLVALLPEELRSRRDHLRKKILERGIETSVYYPRPIPDLSYYQEKYDTPVGQYQNASVISDGAIAFPVGPHVGAEDLEYLSQNAQETLIQEQQIMEMK